MKSAVVIFAGACGLAFAAQPAESQSGRESSGSTSSIAARASPATSRAGRPASTRASRWTSSTTAT